MIAIITPEQKELITGQELSKNCFFNPIMDADEKWVVSEEEIKQCTNGAFAWLNDLELKEYKSIPSVGFL